MAARIEPVPPLLDLPHLPRLDLPPLAPSNLPRCDDPKKSIAKEAVNAAITALGFVKEMTSDPDATRATRAAFAAATAAFCVTAASELEIILTASEESSSFNPNSLLGPQKTAMLATRIATNSISTENKPVQAINFARDNSITPTFANKALQVISAARSVLIPDETKIANVYANAAAYMACVADPRLSKEAAKVIEATPFPCPMYEELFLITQIPGENRQATIDVHTTRVADEDAALFARSATAVLEDGEGALEEDVDMLRSAFQAIRDADVATAAKVAAFFADRARQRLSTSPAIKSARKT